MTAKHNVKLGAIVADLLSTNVFWVDPECPFRAHLDPGAKADPRVLLVAGDNASGKSLLVEYLRSFVKGLHGVSTISISIRERVGAGQGEMNGFRRSMIFGDESVQSTGATSVRVTQTAFNNLDGWTQDGKTVLMVLDEPELGLSSAYSAAMGQLIAQRMSAIAAESAMLVVVTHSRDLARGMAAGLGRSPMFLHMNGAMTFGDWCEARTEKTVDELLALTELGSQGRRAVDRLETRLLDAFRAQEAKDAKDAKDAKERAAKAALQKAKVNPSPKSGHPNAAEKPRFKM